MRQIAGTCSGLVIPHLPGIAPAGDSSGRPSPSIGRARHFWAVAETPCHALVMSKVFWNLDDWPRDPGERIIARGEVGGVPWELAIVPEMWGHLRPSLLLWSPFNGAGADLPEGPIVGHGPGNLDGIPESEGGGYLVSAQVAVDSRVRRVGNGLGPGN